MMLWIGISYLQYKRSHEPPQDSSLFELLSKCKPFGISDNIKEKQNLHQAQEAGNFRDWSNPAVWVDRGYLDVCQIFAAYLGFTILSLFCLGCLEHQMYHVQEYNTQAAHMMLYILII